MARSVRVLSVKDVRNLTLELRHAERCPVARIDLYVRPNADASPLREQRKLAKSSVPLEDFRAFIVAARVEQQHQLLWPDELFAALRHEPLVVIQRERLSED